MNDQPNDFNRWGLKSNPFNCTTSPQDDEVIKRIFVGREKEIKQIERFTDSPKGVFLVGMFGIGKTILLRECLRRANLRGKIGIYSTFDKGLGFCKSILLDFSQWCLSVDPVKTEEILMRGYDGSSTSHNIRDAIIRAASPIYSIGELIKNFGGNTPIILGVDGFNEDVEVRDIQNVVSETRRLIDMGFCVILPGHPIGPTTEFGSSVDIITPVHISPLDEFGYLEIIRKYLLFQRIDNQYTDTYPFSLEIAQSIAKAIAVYQLTPRLLIFACQLLLEQAVQEEAVINIDHEFVKNKWNDIVKNYLLRSLRPFDRKRLEIIYKDEGFLSEDTREKNRQIGGDMAEYHEVRSSLEELIVKNILHETQDDKGKTKISVSPLMTLTDILIR